MSSRKLDIYFLTPKFKKLQKKTRLVHVLCGEKGLSWNVSFPPFVGCYNGSFRVGGRLGVSERPRFLLEPGYKYQWHFAGSRVFACLQPPRCGLGVMRFGATSAGTASEYGVVALLHCQLPRLADERAYSLRARVSSLGAGRWCPRVHGSSC